MPPPRKRPAPRGGFTPTCTAPITRRTRAKTRTADADDASTVATNIPARATSLLEESADCLSLTLEFLSYANVVRVSAVCRLWNRAARWKLDEWALIEPCKGHVVRGLKGRSFGKLRGPSAITSLPSGGLAVVDFLNRRIQVLTQDFAQTPVSGSIRRHEVAATIEEAHCAIPTGICAADSQSIYVADNQSHSILRLALPGHPDGVPPGALLAKVGAYGRDRDELWDPEGLCIDDDGILCAPAPSPHRPCSQP